MSSSSAATGVIRSGPYPELTTTAILVGYGADFNPVLLTFGAIAGKGGVAFIVGGYVCYWILAPLLSQFGLLPVDGETGAVIVDPDSLRLFWPARS